MVHGSLTVISMKILFFGYDIVLLVIPEWDWFLTLFYLFIVNLFLYFFYLLFPCCILIQAFKKFDGSASLWWDCDHNDMLMDTSFPFCKYPFLFYGIVYFFIYLYCFTIIIPTHMYNKVHDPYVFLYEAPSALPLWIRLM